MSKKKVKLYITNEQQNDINKLFVANSVADEIEKFKQQDSDSEFELVVQTKDEYPNIMPDDTSEK